MDSRAAEGATWWSSVRKPFAAGLTSGVVAAFVLHPPDLVKIRLQVNEGTGAANRPQYNGTLDAFRSIYRNSGFAGLYQGVIPNVLGNGISWGLFFFFYNDIKARMQGGDAKKVLGPMREFVASCEAGLLALIISNPLSVAKTRICLQYKQSAKETTKDVYYKGTIDALFKIYGVDGVRGLFKGFLPGVFGVIHGAIQFMMYAEMNNKYNNTHRLKGTVDTRLSEFNACLTFPAISKLIAVLMTYPCQVVRTRLQEQHRSYSGVIDVMKQMIKFEGPRGLYKGVCVHLCQSIPNICIVFMVYQCMTNRAMKVSAMDDDRPDI